MLTYLGRRVLQLVPTLFGVALLTFLIMRLIPGDPTDMAGGQTISEEVRAQLRAQWHLDEPLARQLWIYLKGIPRLDFGVSMRFGVPVRHLIAEYFIRTLQLGLVAFVLSVSVGVTLGIVSALARGTCLDRALLAATLAGISTPVFVVGILLILVSTAAGWHFISASTMVEFEPEYLVLPALTLAVRSIAYLARMTRSAVLEAGTADHLRTARAKGLSWRRVVFRHQLRNAMIPITTVVGLNFADFLTGAIITETVFQWPGLGFLIKRAIEFRDIPVIMGTVLFVTVLFVTINFVVDLLYALFDPRVRYGCWG